MSFTGRGQLNVSPGVQVTINGPLVAPLRQIFSGSGNVVFGSGLVEKVYPQWWGAKADLRQDDSGAINAAINALPAVGGTVFLPAGEYRIENTISVVNRKFIRMAGGAVTGGADSSNTSLFWSGVRGGTVLRLFETSDSEFSNFHIRPNGPNIGVGIDIDGISATNGIFENISVQGPVGSITTGVRIGQTAGEGCDLFIFKQLFVTGATDGVRIAGAQSKWNSFYNCSLLNCENGIISIRGGSFKLYSCNFSKNTVDIYLVNPTDPLTIINAQSEQASRFLVTAAHGSSAVPLTILGSRLESTRIAPDGRYIIYHFGGPLVLLGNSFGTTHVANFKIEHDMDDTDGTACTAIGNQFPNGNVFTDDGRDPPHWWERFIVGNRYVDAAGVYRAYPNQVTTGNTVNTYSLAGVKGLNGPIPGRVPNPAQNLRGSVTLSGSSTSAPVNFATPENNDANYYVSAIVSATSGTIIPGSGQTRVWVTNKTQTGFTVNVEVAPGGANSITVDWHLLR